MTRPLQHFSVITTGAKGRALVADLQAPHVIQYRAEAVCKSRAEFARLLDLHGMGTRTVSATARWIAEYGTSGPPHPVNDDGMTPGVLYVRPLDDWKTPRIEVPA